MRWARDIYLQSEFSKRYERSDSTKLLNLENMSLTAEDVPVIIKFLNEHPVIENLQLGGNKLGPEGAKQIALHNKSATKIGLSNNHLGSEGAKHFARYNRVATTVSLSGNDLGSEGAKNFALYNKVVTKVRLPDNTLYVLGLQQFLQFSTIVRKANLQRNMLDGKETDLLSHLMKSGDLPPDTNVYINSRHKTEPMGPLLKNYKHLHHNAACYFAFLKVAQRHQNWALLPEIRKCIGLLLLDFDSLLLPFGAGPVIEPQRLFNNICPIPLATRLGIFQETLRTKGSTPLCLLQETIQLQLLQNNYQTTGIVMEPNGGILATFDRLKSAGYFYQQCVAFYGLEDHIFINEKNNAITLNANPPFNFFHQELTYNEILRIWKNYQEFLASWLTVNKVPIERVVPIELPPKELSLTKLGDYLVQNHCQWKDYMQSDKSHLLLIPLFYQGRWHTILFSIDKNNALASIAYADSFFEKSPMHFYQETLPEGHPIESAIRKIYPDFPLKIQRLTHSYFQQNPMASGMVTIENMLALVKWAYTKASENSFLLTPTCCDTQLLALRYRHWFMGGPRQDADLSTAQTITARSPA